jgi:formate--tetrahydrofolate ligase
MTVPSALEISRRATLAPPHEIAAKLGIGRHLLEPYGDAVAKIKLEAVAELADRPKAKYVVVTAVTPTRSGRARPPPRSGSGRRSPTSASAA